MTSIIEVEHLTKSYGNKRGITDVSLTIEAGEVFGFLGPNGAGKTTTIRVLMALLRANSGEAKIAGLDCWQQSVQIKRIVGYLPGELSLDPDLTGGQILEYFGHLRGGIDQAYLKQLIARFEFDPTRKFRQYSSGNKRKLGIIQAFMHRPQVLILDEPTSGLDPLNQLEFDSLVKEGRDEGQTVLLSSHILSEVEQTCTRVGIIREGKLVRIGGLSDLKDIKHHEVIITFVNPVSVDVFKQIAGVEHVEASTDAHTLHIAVSDGLDAVIKAASQYSIVTLTSHEPSLEDIFLRYYANNETIPAQEVSHVAQ